jgi:hypothetical protein
MATGPLRTFLLDARFRESESRFRVASLPGSFNKLRVNRHRRRDMAKHTIGANDPYQN